MHSIFFRRIKKLRRNSHSNFLPEELSKLITFPHSLRLWQPSPRHNNVFIIRHAQWALIVQQTIVNFEWHCRQRFCSTVSRIIHAQLHIRQTPAATTRAETIAKNVELASIARLPHQCQRMCVFSRKTFSQSDCFRMRNDSGCDEVERRETTTPFHVNRAMWKIATIPTMNSSYGRLLIVSIVSKLRGPKSNWRFNFSENFSIAVACRSTRSIPKLLIPSKFNSIQVAFLLKVLISRRDNEMCAMLLNPPITSKQFQ